MPTADVDGVLESARLGVFTQLLFKVLTFTLNAGVLRYTTADVLGVANVRLQLLHSTLVFLVCEPFRRCAISHFRHAQLAQFVNTIWIVPVAGCLVGGALSLVWLYVLEQPGNSTTQFYTISVVLYVLSAVIEQLAEPLWILSKILSQARLKSVVEGCAMTAKCVTTIVLLVLAPQLELMAFSIGQLMFGIVGCLGYYVFYFRKLQDKKFVESSPFVSLRQIMPTFRRDNDKSSYFDSSLISIGLSFFMQSFWKQLLTEGERYFMTFTSVLTFEQQGIYDVVNNLGSLVARTLFLPIEEATRDFFCQTLDRGQPANKQTSSAIEKATNLFTGFLRMVTLVGLVMAVFGQSFSRIALHLYGGERLSDSEAPQLLGCYSVYLVFLAINGVTESLCFSVMSESQVNSYNWKLLVFFVVFLLAAQTLMQLYGALGLIVANMVNMALRIAHSCYFIENFYSKSKSKPFVESFRLPQLPVVAAFILSYVIPLCSSLVAPTLLFVHVLINCFVGVVCLFVLCVSLVVFERRTVHLGLQFLPYRLKMILGRFFRFD